MEGVTDTTRAVVNNEVPADPGIDEFTGEDSTGPVRLRYAHCAAYVRLEAIARTDNPYLQPASDFETDRI
jgi:hypothetical protein